MKAALMIYRYMDRHNALDLPGIIIFIPRKNSVTILQEKA